MIGTWRGEGRGLSVVTWNVNGIRAAWRKGLRLWLEEQKPDLVFLQEIRAYVDDLTAITHEAREAGYWVFWNPSTRPGYAGTGMLARRPPLRVETSIGSPELDAEGRTIIAHYASFAAVGCYFPNGNRGADRLSAKLRFSEAVVALCRDMSRKYETVIVCGDFNTAHTELDLANPSANTRKSGFLVEERSWIDALVEAGYVDTYRLLHGDGDAGYTWWCAWGGCRQRNIGWRFDYLFVSTPAVHRVRSATIDGTAVISDHAPVSIHLAGG